MQWEACGGIVAAMAIGSMADGGEAALKVGGAPDVHDRKGRRRAHASSADGSQ